MEIQDLLQFLREKHFISDKEEKGLLAMFDQDRERNVRYMKFSTNKVEEPVWICINDLDDPRSISIKVTEDWNIGT